MKDLIVKATITPAQITSNFAEIRAAVAEQMTAYEGLEVTEETKAERKKDLATLRKIRTAVDDKRKELEKEYMKPFDVFKGEVKEILGEIDKPITKINADLKALDEKRVAEKQAHLRELYESHIGEYAEFLPFEKLKTSKWDNATYKDNDILFDISEAVTKVRSDLDTIKALESPIEALCITTYKMEGLAAAIKRHTEYLAAQKVVEEREKAAPAPVKAEPVEVVEEPTGWVEDAMNPPERTVTFKISGEANIQAVKEFLQFSEIPFEEV